MGSPVPPDSPQPTAGLSDRILVALGFVANVTGVVTFLGSGTGKVVATIGLIAVGAGVLGLIKFWTRPVGRTVAGYVLATALGAGLIGAVVGTSFSEAPAPAVAGTEPSPSASSTPTPTPSPTTTPVAPSPPIPTSPPSPTDDAFQVKRTADSLHPIILSRAHVIDLDSDDPAWGVNTGVTTAGGYDISFSSGGGGYLYAWPGANLAVVSTGLGYEGCRATTAYQESVSYKDTRKGLAVCVRTSDRRLAYLSVVAMPEDRSQISLAVIVWDPPLS